MCKAYMRIAVGFRGITYLETYNHCHGYPAYTIDFRETYPSIQHHIIDAFQSVGHTVDTFIATYDSELKNELIDIYCPKKIKFREYLTVPHERVEECATELHTAHTLDLLEMIEIYEQDIGQTYDFVIITRPDLYFYQRVTDINIDYDTVNLPFWHMNGSFFSSEDNFIAFSRNKLNVIRNIVENIKDRMYVHHYPEYRIGRNLSLHHLGFVLLESGETVKFLFGEKGSGAYDYPIYKLGRQVFGNARVGTVDELVNIPMNRVYHEYEDATNPQPVYLPRPN